MKRKLFCLLTLLLTVCSGAWADADLVVSNTSAVSETFADGSILYSIDNNGRVNGSTKFGSGKDIVVNGEKTKGAALVDSRFAIKFPVAVSSVTIYGYSSSSGRTLDKISTSTTMEKSSYSDITSSTTKNSASTTPNYNYTFTASWASPIAANTAIWFQFNNSCNFYKISYTTSGGGGGATTYVITKETPSNGTISVDKATAAAGETVTLTATPAVGYMLDAWDVYKTGESTTKVSVTDNKFTMPAYAVSVNATFVVDSRKKVLYVTSDGTVNAGDDLYAALNEDYNVTKIAYNGSATLTNYDLVVLHESIAGSNAKTGLVAAAKTANVPVLNTKSYFYNDGRWDWGTPNAGKTVKVATLNSIAYSNIASHPIFAGITPVDGDIDVVGTAVAKAMQPVTDLVSGKEGYTLATTPNADSGNGTAIHELTPTMRGVSNNAKYLMISVSDACLNDLSENGVKLFKNAAAYLINNEAQWVPAAASYTVTYKANGGTGDDVVVNPATTIAANTFGAPSGKVFIGWNTASDGSGDAWAIGASVTSNLTLFAQWEESVVVPVVSFTIDGDKNFVADPSDTGITINPSKASNTTYYQFGSNDAITITAPFGKRITGITVNYNRYDTKSKFTVNGIDNDSYSVSEKKGTWTGSAAQVAIVSTATSGQDRVSSISVSYSEGVSETVTLNSNGYATLSKHFGFTVSGAKAYKAALDESNSKITCTEVAKVPAGAGVLLFGSANAVATLSKVDDATTLKDNDLKGTTAANASLVAKTGTNNFYALSGSSFVPYTASTFAAFKAYFETDIDLGAHEFSIFFEDEGETTGISEVRGLKADVRGEFFNLNGQRVAQPTKGLYIVNGRKVVIK